MAEVLGIVASATQLSVACISLIDIIRKIKGGASTLHRYHSQLQELRNISVCISENPLLQTREIGAQTEVLFSIINNNCINPLLRKGRILRTWGLLCREQDLLETFATLERQKSNLSLAIEQIQSKALYQIQNDIQLMADRNPRRASSEASSRSGRGANASSNSSAPRSPPQTSTGPYDIRRYLETHFASLPQVEPSDGSNSGGTTGPQWNNAVAGPGIEQHNGRHYLVNGPFSREIFANRPENGNQNPVTFNNPVSIGDGDQYNQNVAEYSGDIRGATEPDMSRDMWNNPQALPWPSADPGARRRGRQVNGYVIRYNGPNGDAQES